MLAALRISCALIVASALAGGTSAMAQTPPARNAAEAEPAKAEPEVRLTTTSPAVLKAVERGVEFLKTARGDVEGADAIIALALLKTGTPHEHPRIQEALEAVKKMVATKNLEGISNVIYSLTLSAIFLANLDPELHRDDIQKLLDKLLKFQKQHGGWGYLEFATGDTSMTQYAVLCLWELEEAGFRVPIEAWEGVANWLLRTQDPLGGFGYQGQDPGNFNLIRQREVRHSLVCAAMGSLYIAKHQLRLGGTTTTSDLPAALQRLDATRPSTSGPRSTRINLSRLREALAMGDRWYKEHYEIQVREYQHYYLYTLERYQSFRELALGAPDDSLPWYHDGAKYELAHQGFNGAWSGDYNDGVSTAFAVLFLIRSTQKRVSNSALGGGTLVAGRGLPPKVADVRVRDGKVVAKPVTGPADKLLSMLEDPTDPSFLGAVEGFTELTLQADESTLNEHALRLRKLAGSENPEARLAAVKALAKGHDLENVPTLIYALTDPDTQIMWEAESALRRLSRKFEGYLPQSAGPADARAAATRWKKWYLTLRPDAEFID